jgi:hypothetical protein
VGWAIRDQGQSKLIKAIKVKPNGFGSHSRGPVPQLRDPWRNGDHGTEARRDFMSECGYSASGSYRIKVNQGEGEGWGLKRLDGQGVGR